MIRGAIFDFDGLILDTEGPIYQSWAELYHQFKQGLPFETWAAFIGTSELEQFDPFNLLEEKLGHPVDRANLKPRRRKRELDLIATQPILPGVVKLLQQIQTAGLKLGIASSSDREWVGGHLNRLELHHFFEVIHTSDDVSHTKPDPELYLLALKSLGLKPEEAIVFEDSPNGVTAARRAGIFTVAVPNPLTARLPLEHASLRLKSLADLSLAEIIAKIP